MRASERRHVEKPIARLTENEVDPASGCTVCTEDQVELRLDGVAPFRVCRHLAKRIEGALRNLQERGIPLRTVDAYRVGLTRGPADARGYRGGFSHHSYGIALDINSASNGLYESCPEPGPRCRLRRGGPWEPGRDPLSMTPGHPVVAAMNAIGLRWGGELVGQQKDFMHFSPSGD